ncbi:acyltransferase domain-containing protein [Streptomyces baarnensis]|uniref:acyltransferase domain-containing protein n=1 Tax=Streptomyces griseus group TaxID=629295 RepID=UPI0030819124
MSGTTSGNGGADREAGPEAEVHRWLTGLARRPAVPTVADPVAPAPVELAERMDLLDIPGPDREEVSAGLPDPRRTPALWEALLHCHRQLYADAAPGTDARSAVPDWPDAPAALGSSGRYFYVHLYLLALPHALERQRRLGIPDEVVAATFADLGAKLTTYRRAHGTGGFDRQRWMVHHFRGVLHRLGRLQFERGVLDAEACGGDAADTGGPAHGCPVLKVHVPGDGPLDREGCDASFDAARAFFARRFPETPFRHAMCSSWLLDRQLGAYLPREANILAFQRRFTEFGARPVGDDDVLEFVFHVPPGTADLGRLPRATTLQRSLVRHLRSGGHWRTAHGWTFLR